MNTSQKEIVIQNDEKQGELFYAFFEQIYLENMQYFQNRNDNYNHINSCFLLISDKRPPYYRLRYVRPSKLDETILNKVVRKYKELFGIYADYETIP